MHLLVFIVSKMGKTSSDGHCAVQFSSVGIDHKHEKKVATVFYSCFFLLCVFEGKENIKNNKNIERKNCAPINIRARKAKRNIRIAATASEREWDREIGGAIEKRERRIKTNR